MNEAPIHVGIIMDGNSRWALKKSLPKIEGYKKGAEVAVDVVFSCLYYGIKYLTLYAFSTENWNRDKNDINSIFSLFITNFNEYVEQLLMKSVAINFIGDIASLPLQMHTLIDEMKYKLPTDVKCTLNIAMSYGSRQEILEAVKKAILLKKNVEEVDLDFFNSLLYTAGIPDPDLIIRTSGEKRLSNFLLWQSAYSELYFCDVMWPDFDAKCFENAIEDYKVRVRKYGK